MDIEQVLARRTDLSTFLVHLTRSSENSSALDNLIQILTEQCIKAVSPFGMAFQKLQNPSDDLDSAPMDTLFNTQMLEAGGKIQGIKQSIPCTALILRDVFMTLQR